MYYPFYYNYNALWSYPIITLIVFVTINTGCGKNEQIAEEYYAITNVNILPMNREIIIENHTVLIRDGYIHEIIPSDPSDIPDGAIRIDGTGRYLIPGITEMHGHVPGPDIPGYAENVLYLYISNGVTTVRNMAGNPFSLELREKIKNGEIIGPTLYAASPYLRSENVTSPKEAEKAVLEWHNEGYDLLKMGSINLETYNAVVEAAHDIGIPFAGHIPAEVGLERALEVQQATIDHFDRYVEFMIPENVSTDGRRSGFFGSGIIDLIDRERMPEALSKTIEAGTWNVPTLSIVEHLATPESPENMADWPEMKYLPRHIIDRWVQAKKERQSGEDFQPDAAQKLVEFRRDLLKVLHDGGAPIAFGSDAPQFFNVPGFSIHHEIRMMIDAGLSPFEALVTATKNPAVYFNSSDQFGTVEVGRRADLVLLNANPMIDISNLRDITGVMVSGTWIPQNEIQSRLDEIAEWAQNQ